MDHPTRYSNNENNPNPAWDTHWFDSPYYHALYQHRNDEEAQGFIDRILPLLSLNEIDPVLDLACGKGRHAAYLNAKGLNVEGVDYSPNNIETAQKLANDRLRFQVHDMRKLIRPNAYQAIFNLFTSFGYFSEDQENWVVFDRMAEMLRNKGKLVFDYLNDQWVRSRLVQEESIERVSSQGDPLQFDIKRWVDTAGESDQVKKSIVVKQSNQVKAQYQEAVKLYTPDMLTTQLAQRGFTINDRFGDYDLSPFDPGNSKRLILVLSIEK